MPSLSVLDGGWLEGCVEGVMGRAISEYGDGAGPSADDRDRLHAQELYQKLQRTVMSSYYETIRARRMRRD